MIALALALAAGVPATTRAESISYERGPCLGYCPVYKVTVSSDGRGTFEGGQQTAVKGVRRFRVSSAQFAEFRKRLRADRPVGEVLLNGPPLCREIATDQITVDVHWSGAGKQPAHLSAYLGCDMDKNQRLFQALVRAPAALPIASFIGKPSLPR